MIFKAKIIYDIDDDGKERTVSLTNEEFYYLVKHCKDLNDVSEFINLKLSKRSRNKTA